MGHVVLYVIGLPGKSRMRIPEIQRSGLKGPNIEKWNQTASQVEPEMDAGFMLQVMWAVRTWRIGLDFGA